MRASLWVALLLAAGCAPTPVDVRMEFPSLSTFLYSEFGRLLAFEVERDELGRCPAILEQAQSGAGEPVLDSGWQPICTFRNGGVRFDGVPPGPHAFVALARDEANTILLAGCRMAEAYEAAPPVEIDLFPTREYDDSTAGRMLACGSEEDKCTRGCR